MNCIDCDCNQIVFSIRRIGEEMVLISQKKKTPLMRGLNKRRSLNDTPYYESGGSNRPRESREK